MAKVSELISKYIISLYNGKMEGVVENILFDYKTKRAKFFVVYDSTQDNKLLLNINNIYSIGSGAISIKNSSCLSLCESLELENSMLNSPINSNAFKINGDLLGNISDVVLDSKHYIKSLILNNGMEIDSKVIANYKNNTVIVYDENSKVNINNFFEKKKAPTTVNDSRIVNILEIKDENANEEKLLKVVKPTHVGMRVPNRAITNYNFLINRKVSKNILTLDGEVLIRQNTKINSTTINLARINGKLNELTKYSD